MAEWNRRIACQYNPFVLRRILDVCLLADNPAEHQLLQSGDGLVLDAKRLRSLDVKLGRVGPSMIEHVLRRDDVATGRLVIFGGDAASQQDRRKIRQKRSCALQYCLVPDGDPAVGAFDKRLQRMRQRRLGNERDRNLLPALQQEQTVAILRLAWDASGAVIASNLLIRFGAA
ncbi:hypothetical protein [Sinorhizobium medicae]|uniref:hypothetical protein n=1 Tax=Sinorhizobium medicae TaxID=110321 RepID=UPI0003633C76|nr:hypothetical protein [Sinorhizobium medicae]